jgi:hypothetical protein
MYTDTPVPQEEAAGENPPDGAMIDYYLNEKATDIQLEITQSHSFGDGTGRRTLIRRYSNADTLYKIPPVNYPHYWLRPQKILSAEPGHHRFLWDMKYEPLNLPVSYPISATYMNTEPNQTSPWVMPGTYTATLTVDGKVYIQTFTIKMDPRVKTSLPDLQKQKDLSFQCYTQRNECVKIIDEIRSYRSSLKSRITNPDELNKKDKEAAAFELSPQGSNDWSFGRLNTGFTSVFNVLQDSDTPPTTQMIYAVKELNQQMIVLKKKWENLKK